LRQVGAERVRGLLARQSWRGGRAGLREHALLHSELRASGVAGAAVPLVDAAAVGAPHARRDISELRRLQADDRLELAERRCRSSKRTAPLEQLTDPHRRPPAVTARD
jgi:hypothetical protein